MCPRHSKCCTVAYFPISPAPFSDLKQHPCWHDVEWRVEIDMSGLSQGGGARVILRALSELISCLSEHRHDHFIVCDLCLTMTQMRDN